MQAVGFSGFYYKIQEHGHALVITGNRKSGLPEKLVLAVLGNVAAINRTSTRISVYFLNKH